MSEYGSWEQWRERREELLRLGRGALFQPETIEWIARHGIDYRQPRGVCRDDVEAAHLIAARPDARVQP